MRNMALTIWYEPRLRVAYLQHFKSQIQSLHELGKWLMTFEGGWINLVHLVVWAWETQPSLTLIVNRAPLQTRGRSVPLGDSSNGDPKLSEWCHNLQLNDQDQQVLSRLGFVVGDNLHTLTEQHWEQGGARVLQRLRILAAFDRYISMSS